MTSGWMIPTYGDGDSYTTYDENHNNNESDSQSPLLFRCIIGDNSFKFPLSLCSHSNVKWMRKWDKLHLKAFVYNLGNLPLRHLQIPNKTKNLCTCSLFCFTLTDVWSSTIFKRQIALRHRTHSLHRISFAIARIKIHMSQFCAL